MQYTRLGTSGLKVSRICLGMMTYGSTEWREWVKDKDTCYEHVKRALELGINFFDTANMYSLGESEKMTGRALKKFAQRDEVVIATKVYFKIRNHPNGGGLSRKHIMDQVDASLRRLRTDYIDLYQIHRWDYETPIEETLEALHDVVKAGKVRYIGASSMYAWQFCKSLYLAELHGWSRFISMQNHYNLIYREEEREMNPLCEAEGVGLIPWSPLARGVLTGSRTRQGSNTLRAKTDTFNEKLYYHDSDFDVADAVEKVARNKGISRAQVALAWLLQRPNVAAPIVGTSKLEHLEDAVKAVEVSLTEEEIQTLEAPYKPHPVLGHQ
ncbi:MAG: aldo/keto reductase [Bacteroidetes bacterium]|nr:MAG: aldo/keto reductase [Bacteroidota bacterium]